MKHDNLPPIEKYDFAASYQVEPDPKIKIKLLALHHVQFGLSPAEVSKMVLAKEKTLPSWIDALVEFDYEGLIEREGRGRKPRLPPEKEEDFKIELDKMQVSFQGGRITAKNIKQLLINSIVIIQIVDYRLLDLLYIVWISGRSKDPKSSEEAILAFKENFPDEVEKITKQIKNDQIEVWWPDESRIGQQGSLTRQWATKGTRPRVIRQTSLFPPMFLVLFARIKIRDAP